MIILLKSTFLDASKAAEDWLVIAGVVTIFGYRGNVVEAFKILCENSNRNNLLSTYTRYAPILNNANRELAVLSDGKVEWGDGRGSIGVARDPTVVLPNHWSSAHEAASEIARLLLEILVLPILDISDPTEQQALAGQLLREHWKAVAIWNDEVADYQERIRRERAKYIAGPSRVESTPIENDSTCNRETAWFKSGIEITKWHPPRKNDADCLATSLRAFCDPESKDEWAGDSLTASGCKNDGVILDVHNTSEAEKSNKLGNPKNWPIAYDAESKRWFLFHLKGKTIRESCEFEMPVRKPEKLALAIAKNYGFITIKDAINHLARDEENAVEIIQRKIIRPALDKLKFAFKKHVKKVGDVSFEENLIPCDGNSYRPLFSIGYAVKDADSRFQFLTKSELEKYSGDPTDLPAIMPRVISQILS